MRKEVLDKGFVELQGVFPELKEDVPLFRHVVNSARTSYLGETKGYEQDLKLFRYLWEHQHSSPFEFIQFQFRIKSPLLVQNQWVRHRTGSFNIQSYRYVELEQDDFYTPSSWRLQSKKNKQASDGELDFDNENSKYLFQEYEKLLKESQELYFVAVSSGVSRELARVFLPSYSLYSTMVWSVDLRNLIHFLQLRTAPEAQYEIREYALAISDIIKTLSPEIYEVCLANI